jgi:hypothetical protein
MNDSVKEKPMKRLGVLLLVLFAGLLMGFSKNDLRQDMVKLDKAYIAALALTSQGKVAESRKAMEILGGSWNQFKDRHYGANPDDPQWKKDLDAVDHMIAEAAQIVVSDRKVTDAHEALEEVRMVMMKLRARNGIEYFVDQLTAFHEPMEAIVLAAKDKTPETLSDADMQRIRETLPEAEKLWARAMAENLDGPTYQLEASQLERARKLMQAEQQALAALKSALAGGDKPSIIKAAVAIKPNFAALFMTFGDFTPFKV